ncbi:MAG: hypothetical protein N2449_06690 [Bacteroidales bacterium]|nr:hypothetical protein [Bacteroidales bacterium]
MPRYNATLTSLSEKNRIYHWHDACGINKADITEYFIDFMMLKFDS